MSVKYCVLCVWTCHKYSDGYVIRTSVYIIYIYIHVQYVENGVYCLRECISCVVIMLQPFGKASSFSDKASLSIHDVTRQTTVIFGSHWCNKLKFHAFKAGNFSLCMLWTCREEWMYSSTDSYPRNQLVWMVSFTPQRHKHVWESIPVFIEEEVRWVPGDIDSLEQSNTVVLPLTEQRYLGLPGRFAVSTPTTLSRPPVQHVIT